MTGKMTLYESLVAKRSADRLRAADAAAREVLAALHAEGIDVRLFGSLAHGNFKAHSDVDFLVRGAVSPRGRALVETTMAQTMGAADLPYDVIYLDDLTAEQAAVFDRA